MTDNQVTPFTLSPAVLTDTTPEAPLSSSSQPEVEEMTAPSFLLPSETWDIIFRMVGKEGCCELRLSSSSFLDILPKNYVKTMPEIFFSLRPHQLEALHWMASVEVAPSIPGQKGGMLSLEMGLGKTRTCLKLMTYKRSRTLVVTPKTTMLEWLNESKRVNVSDRVVTLHSDVYDMKQDLFPLLDTHSVFVTTYDVIKNRLKDLMEERKEDYEPCKVMVPHSIIPGEICFGGYKRMDSPYSYPGEDLFFSTVWDRVVFDESQAFKTPSTKCFSSCLSLCASKVWCLTGTPISNRGLDMWPPLFMCGYSRVSRPGKWDSHKVSQNNTRPWIHQRSVSEVVAQDNGFNIPKPTIHRVLIDFLPNEAGWYTRTLRRLREVIQMGGVRLPYMKVLPLFNRLRGVCVSPLYLDEEEKRVSGIGPDDYFSEKIRTVLGCIRTESRRRKIVVFSFWSSVLRRMNDTLSDMGISSDIIDGKVTSMVERHLIIGEFNSSPDLRVLLCNTKSCGAGLNIPGGECVFFLEPWWNSSETKQCIGRVCRLGSNKSVDVYYFLYRDSIEMAVRKLCRIKEQLARSYKESRDDLYKPMTLDIETIGRLAGLWGGIDPDNRALLNNE